MSLSTFHYLVVVSFSCIIFKGLCSGNYVFSVVKEHEHGIQDKAILFTSKHGFVYKDILLPESKPDEEFELLVLISCELI